MTKTVLVCGASGGLGAVVARHFHDQGYQVFGTMRDPSRVTGLPYEMRSLDATSDESATACITNVIEKAGKIDVMINCFNNMTLGSVSDCGMDEMTAMFEVNVLGAMRMCKAVLPSMLEAGHGTIINMSSLGGILAAPYLSGYTSTKFALEAYSEALYHEIRHTGVSVVIMQPVAMAMEREDTGDHLQLARNMAADSPAHAMVARMIADTKESQLTPATVAAKIYDVAEMPKKPLRVPMDRAKPISLVKRLAPQAMINKLIDNLLSDAPAPV